MRRTGLAIGLLALALGAQMLLAQQPGQRPARPGDSMMAASRMMQQRMQMMDSLDARLDTLVYGMHRATGSRKIEAMAAVITELVAQRKAMRQYGRERMQSRPGMMMRGMGAPAPAEVGPPATPPDSAPGDSAGHEQHHPPD